MTILLIDVIIFITSSFTIRRLKLTLKKEIIQLLYENRGEYISGEFIARKLFVTRATVWKAINSLKLEGYSINGISNKGYSLNFDTDIICASMIKPLLNHQNNAIKYDIDVLDTVNSTNSYLKSKLSENIKEGKVIIAEHQSEGKGRFERDFFSPKGTGVYMSILLRPKIKAEQSSTITGMIAVSVAEAINELTDSDAKIKWVNDVYIGDKKVCGVLTQASYSLESGKFDYVIVGIGVNVYRPLKGFGDIEGKATSITTQNDGFDLRNTLVANILNKISYHYKELDQNEILQRYRGLQYLIGKQVEYDTDEIRRGIVVGVDDQFRLIVENVNGGYEHLCSGEVSVIVVK